MASGTAKGKRKTKGKTVDLHSFLADSPAAPEGYTAIPNVSWTSLMDDDNADPFLTNNEKPQVILPTAPKASRPPNIDLSKVPNNAPFKAHLANLPYDISEDDIISFFRKLDIKEVQLPRDGSRLKGFGYAEFYDRDALIEALNFNNETLKNRSITVSLPSNDGGNDEKRPYRQRDDHRRDRDEQREDRTDENWRSQNQRPVLSDQRFNSRNGDSRESRGMDSNRRDGDRNFDRFSERRRDRQFGSNFSRDRQSPPLERDIERNREGVKEAPQERKKLALKPRTVKAEEKQEEKAEDKALKSSSIFGDAKPVDTTAREKEVEEKLAKKEEELLEKRRDSESEPEKEGRRSRKISETGSTQNEEKEIKHIEPPPRRTFEDRPAYRKNNDNRPPMRRDHDRYEHDSFRRTEGDGYGFKGRSRDNDRFDSYNRRSNYQNDNIESRRNNKPTFNSNRYSHSNRREFSNEGDNRNYSQNRNHHHQPSDNDEQTHEEDSKQKEYKSSNKFDLLDNDVDIDGASN